MKAHVFGLSVRCLLIGASLLMCSHEEVSGACPELLGRWPYGAATAVAVEGDRAYVGSGTVLLVLDVATPATPTLLDQEISLPM